MGVVSPGDPLRIRAADWNAVRELAGLKLDQLVGAPDLADRAIIRVRNDSGADRNRYEVVGISAPVIKRTGTNANPAGFFAETIMSAILPSSDKPVAYGVLIDATPAGKIGRCRVAGHTLCRVHVVSEDHTAAIVTDADTKLTTDSRGTARILWMEAEAERAEEGIAWALVLLGAGGTGAIELVHVEKDGGSAGDHETQCSFTYVIWPIGGNSTEPLAATRVPHLARTAIGSYTEAPSGSYGLAFFDGAIWHLLIAFGEFPHAGVCPNE